MSLQIGRIIFLGNLKIMKKVLDLIGFKFDRRTKDYKYFKSQIMDYFYKETRKILQKLVEKKIIKKCPKHKDRSIRKGYCSCENNCGGSGYVNYKN